MLFGLSLSWATMLVSWEWWNFKYGSAPGSEQVFSSIYEPHCSLIRTSDIFVQRYDMPMMRIPTMDEANGQCVSDDKCV